MLVPGRSEVGVRSAGIMVMVIVIVKRDALYEYKKRRLGNLHIQYP